MLITGLPNWGNGETDANGHIGGWNTSYSDDGGKTWSEYKNWHEKKKDGTTNYTIVAMASLIQLKDKNGNNIQKWMGVYHDVNYVNYKTYLTFDESGNEQWSDPEPYLNEYRTTESKYQMCEIGMFRSPDGKRIVGLARSQSHNNPSTLIYSDDEGETWSEPMDLPGSLAGERHKAMYDPISGKLVITFREIQFDLNNNNQFDGANDWMAGDWVAWVGTYEDLMEQNDGQCHILLCEDWANNRYSGDTGYTGFVVLSDGTFVMDSYGHWDKEFSQSWQGSDGSGYNIKTIATKYPNVAREYFAEKGMDIEIIKIEGSVELAPLLELADGIVDIVETGTTLRENGLQVVTEFMPISARFIANKASYQFKHAEMDTMLEKLRAELQNKEEAK